LSADRILIAFASQAGTTATIAAAIGAVLRRYGLEVEMRAARDVADVTPYSSVILGSGMYVPSRHSDGGGFLARHAADLATRKVWLYCAGPIGRRRCVDGSQADDAGECAVMAVAKDVGARGWAVFGPRAVDSGADLVERLGPVDLARVRAWAAEIGEALAPPSRAVRPVPEPGGGAPGARDGEPAARDGGPAPENSAPATPERTTTTRSRDACHVVTHS
jgi:menaquinone-dependent protoporphyrinogen oxidase